MALRNVAIAGASGNIGGFIVTALQETKNFNITVLTRSGSNSKHTYGADIKTRTINYDDLSSVEAALQGQDAVISATGFGGSAEQEILLSAAVNAGVKRFIPSDFGSDTQNPLAIKLPVFDSKAKMNKRLEQLASEGKISYTIVVTGPWLDYLLDLGFVGLDLKKRVLTTMDGGEKPFSTTTRPAVGVAVAGVLAHPDETKNRTVYSSQAVVTQKQLLALSKQVMGSEGWTEVDGGTTEATAKTCYEKLAKGQADFGVMIGFLQSAIFRDGYGGLFQNPDSQLLGVPQLQEADILKLIQEANKA